MASSDELDKRHTEILIEEEDFLTGRISMRKRLLIKLFGKRIINGEERQGIESQTLESKKVSMLLEILRQKSGWFYTFCEILKEDEQTHIATKLLAEDEKRGGTMGTLQNTVPGTGPSQKNQQEFREKKLKVVVTSAAEDKGRIDMLFEDLSADDHDSLREAITSFLDSNITIQEIRIENREIRVDVQCKTEESIGTLKKKSIELTTLITNELFGKIGRKYQWNITIGEDDIVMISYSWSQSAVIDKIQDRLQNEGFNIWRDIKDMGDNLMAGMAEALQKSSVMLACLSENYATSANCMREAKAAEDINKRLIPLIVQKGYRVPRASELGLVLGDRVWIDVSDEQKFSTKMDEVVRRLRLKGDGRHETTAPPVATDNKETSAPADKESTLKELLITHRGKLVTAVRLEYGLWDELMAARVINARVMGTIKGKGAREDQVGELLNELQDRPLEDMEKFIQALEKTNQQHLAKLLKR